MAHLGGPVPRGRRDLCAGLPGPQGRPRSPHEGGRCEGPRDNAGMKHPEDCESIEDVHQAIDVLDREIIHLIGRWAGYVEKAARCKTGEQGVRAPERQRTMLVERRRWAGENGLDPDVIEDTYRNLVYYFVGREMQRYRK